MSCHYCDHNDHQHWFWAKIGRCQRCIKQLTALSILTWGGWWFIFQNTPKSVQSITMLMFACAFTGLLFLHFWMKWVVFPLRERSKKK